MANRENVDNLQHYSRVYKEYQWINSNNISSELTMSIIKLSIPINVSDQYDETDLSITAQIVSNQIVLHEIAVTTNYTSKDQSVYLFNYLMIFPVKIRDLSLDSLVILAARKPNGQIVGSTTIHLFDENGLMKSGKQKLLFYFNTLPDDNVVLSYNKTPGELSQHFINLDHSFKYEKLLESFMHEKLLAVPSNSIDNWLDRCTYQQIIKSLESNALDLELNNYGFLLVELVIPIHPIIYEDRTYSKVSTSFSPPTHVSSIANGICYENSELNILEFILTPNKPFNASTLQVIADWDSEQDNLCEDMHRRINIDSLRHSHDIHIKPNLKDKEQIDRILAMTGVNPMSFQDMDLLYRFRYTLTDNPKALTKFLLAVDWNSDAEIAEVQGLLNMWKENADTLDIADALKLLGREKAFQNPIVREYAVEVLQRASDDELLTYLLQLVQALRYEPIATISTSTRPLSPLAKFLITRGSKSPIVANYLYWYLKVEIDDEVSGHLFQEIFDTFNLTLEKSSIAESKELALRLEAQDLYVTKILQCQREARELGRKKDGKEIALRKLLTERNLAVIPSKGVDRVPLPLQPSKSIYGLNPATASMFASAVYPCVIEFYTAANTGGPVPIHKIMFKSGDDLRQDQLIMQMIALMDRLLKRVNLDLKLLTYGILAVSQNDGIMEFVSDSLPISAILKQYNSITAYLKTFNPDETGPYGIASNVVDSFVKSCAGYCVISYILGIGDRHLDNLMLTKSGQFFHIDFGFIFGQDPKPLPPPFRLTRSMVDAMGGEESEHYFKFKSYCYQAYNWLRKSANLVLNLLSLMGDAGINDISKRSDLTRVLMKVEEKFRLDLSDEEAEHCFQGLINESLNSFAPKVMDFAHKIAVSLR